MTIAGVLKFRRGIMAECGRITMVNARAEMRGSFRFHVGRVRPIAYAKICSGLHRCRQPARLMGSSGL